MTTTQMEQTRRALIARVVVDHRALLMEQERITAAWAPYMPTATLN